jgi:hypothetical protein
MLRALIIFLVGAGLIAGAYAMRPDVPIRSATASVPQPAPPALSAATADAFLAMAIKPIAANVDAATIRSEGVKGRDADAPRAEFAREPRSVGWGDSYAVRLVRPSGQPMVVVEIVLIAQMADGTVETIAMGALPEAGIYRATLPRGSVPINLHVGVGSGENRVKIQVRRWPMHPRPHNSGIRRDWADD